MAQIKVCWDNVTAFYNTVSTDEETVSENNTDTVDSATDEEVASSTDEVSTANLSQIVESLDELNDGLLQMHYVSLAMLTLNALMLGVLFASVFFNRLK